MSEHARHIGIAGVSAEGALLCARTILGRAEERWPLEQRPQVSMHMHPFAAYGDAMARGDLETVTGLLLDSIARTARAGADFAIIPANATHIVIDDVSRRALVPVINLIEGVAEECRRQGYRRVGILGVRWTMRSGLYDAPLRRRDIEPVVPNEEDQRDIHAIITDELFGGRILGPSTERMVAVIARLKAAGCDAVVLACTELPLALSSENCGLPAIDTTRFLAELALARCAGASAGGA